MSKSILSIGLAVVAIGVAIFQPELLPLIGLQAGTLAGTAVVAAVEIGLSLASSALLGPSVPKGLNTGPTQRLYATLDTTSPRKIWFGDTAGATDVRYQTYTGSNQDHYKDIVAHASHEVQSIDEIWFDNEKAWNGSVLGRYASFLSVTTRTVGTSSNGIAIDSVWTSTATLTGCAYTYFDYNLVGPDDSHPSPFQSGVSNRITVRGKGAKTYDPRLDSTQTGGSGTHRATDQTTWTWDDNGSRNPALQLLWYMIGWRINGKLAVGMGMPPSRIDMQSFMTAANICDESVALAAGGSEPRYRSDGVLSEGDDRSAVIDQLCATMNATLRDNGGKIAVQILYNDLATPVADFDLDDLVGSSGDEAYEQTQPLSQYFNIVRGRRVDPSDNALYQLTDFPEVSITAPDGIDRIQTIDFPFVQSNGQVQRLAKLRLLRAQYQARYSATFGPRAWAVSLGNVVRMTHGGLNWTTKLFRVVGQSIGSTGQVKMTLQEENSNVYSWAGEDISGITPGTPTVADPTLDPLLGDNTTRITNLIKLSSIAPGFTFSVSIPSGGNSTVVISNNTRVYSDKSVSVTGNGAGQSVACASGDLLLCYYDDQDRAGGSVTYQFLVLAGGVGDQSSAFASPTHPYRHAVFAKTVPASGGSTSGGSSAGSGGGSYGSGGGGGGLSLN